MPLPATGSGGYPDGDVPVRGRQVFCYSYISCHFPFINLSKVCTLTARLPSSERSPWKRKRFCGPVCFLHRRPPFQAPEGVYFRQPNSQTQSRVRRSTIIAHLLLVPLEPFRNHLLEPVGCADRVRYRQNPFFPRGRRGRYPKLEIPHLLFARLEIQPNYQAKQKS
jgi:hypothetical protein